ncbi:MAG: hypothetical protein R3F24_02845 [Gammaproteobacteria bacterium]
MSNGPVHKPIRNRHVRGKLIYWYERDGRREERGREWFMTTWYPDGQRTLRAVSEIDKGLAADRIVTRDVTYTVDRDRQPLDCHIRLHQDGQFLGAGWFNFRDGRSECQTWGIPAGRVSQCIEGTPPSFGAHAITCDATHLERFDHGRPEKVQPARGVYLSSPEHDGCSGPMLFPINFSIEYVGRETITVDAGTFETDHYRFLLEGSLEKEHPTEELWVTPDDFICVKVYVGGYMNASFELAELETSI